MLLQRRIISSCSFLHVISDNEIRKLRKKIQDQQKINQAKLLLIEQYHYSEEKAHHYIEKVAMDHSITKVEVAMSLIEKVKKNE